MVWRIHSWFPESGTGTVVSPHFGPWAFGLDENPFGTNFEVGEEVLVELDGPKEAHVVRAVTAARQRQPEGTECPAFAQLNAGSPGELRIDEWTDVELRFWAGDCCEWCSLESWTVVFEHPIAHGLDRDTDLGNPLLRYASPEERKAHRLLGSGWEPRLLHRHRSRRRSRRSTRVHHRAESGTEHRRSKR